MIELLRLLFIENDNLEIEKVRLQELKKTLEYCIHICFMFEFYFGLLLLIKWFG